jgi:hypothetical protein
MHQQIPHPAVASHFAKLLRAGLVAALVVVLFATDIAPLAAQTQKKSASPSRKGSADADTTPATPKASKKASRRNKEKDKNSVEGIADYSSPHFLMHTDLADEEAEELLDRLETMLDLISKYWTRPPSGIIEMFVVKNLSRWPNGSIPEEGLDSIEGGAGVTVTRRISSGNAFVAKSIVYAIADRGTPQHEAVHAYCGQAFGRSGPLWYSEGMAEMGQYWRANDSSVNIHPGVLRYLQQSAPKSLNEIVNAREITGDSWQNYAWRWALCHLLANNTNYASRFRPLGLAILTNQADASFEQTYGDMAQEISFEYRQFLQHVDNGLRADLSSWDWKAKFKVVKSGTVTQARVEAAKGWQPSRLIVTEGEEYEYSAAGNWTISKDAGPLDGDGAVDGAGRLVGALLTEEKQDYSLGEEFELGKFGTFTAPGGGKLYLRCRDRWTDLANNRGNLTVKLKLKDKGPPLAPPKSDDEKKKPTDKPKPGDMPQPADTPADGS